MKIEKHSGDSKTLFPLPLLPPIATDDRVCYGQIDLPTGTGERKDHHLRKRYFSGCLPPRRKSDVGGRRLSKDLDCRRKWKIPFKTLTADALARFQRLFSRSRTHVYYVHNETWNRALPRRNFRNLYVYCVQLQRSLVQSITRFRRTAAVDVFPVLYSFKAKNKHTQVMRITVRTSWPVGIAR